MLLNIELLRLNCWRNIFSIADGNWPTFPHLRNVDYLNTVEAIHFISLYGMASHVVNIYSVGNISALSRYLEQINNQVNIARLRLVKSPWEAAMESPIGAVDSAFQAVTEPTASDYSVSGLYRQTISRKLHHVCCSLFYQTSHFAAIFLVLIGPASFTFLVVIILRVGHPQCLGTTKSFALHLRPYQLRLLRLTLYLWILWKRVLRVGGVKRRMSQLKMSALLSTRRNRVCLIFHHNL